METLLQNADCQWILICKHLGSFHQCTYLPNMKEALLRAHLGQGVHTQWWLGTTKDIYWTFPGTNLRIPLKILAQPWLTFPLKKRGVNLCLFPFQLHWESSEAQSRWYMGHGGKILDVNGHALPRGKEICKLLFKALTLWFWNKNASLPKEKERF